MLLLQYLPLFTYIVSNVHTFSPSPPATFTFLQEERQRKITSNSNISTNSKKTRTNRSQTLELQSSKNKDNGKKKEKKDGNKKEKKDSNKKEKKDSNKGRNWIERSTPTGISTSITSSEDSKTEVVEYTLQLDGDSFDLGALSLRIYNTILTVAAKRFGNEIDSIPEELLSLYKITSMDLAAKEAAKLALEQNNLAFVVLGAGSEDDWGMIDSIQVGARAYSSAEEAVRSGSWEPGTSFTFLVRNVAAQEKAESMDDLLKQLDPNGRIAEELEKRLDMPDDPMERILSLRDLAEDNERRANAAPIGADTDSEMIVGQNAAVQNVLSFDRICDAWHGKDTKAYNTLMEALESNSYILVSLNDPNARIMQNMWNTVHDFFETTIPNKTTPLPPIAAIPEAGSRTATVGYASYENDSMQFLETRMQRITPETESKVLYPENVLGSKENERDITDSFALLSNIGKYITQIAVDASNVELNIPAKESKVLAKLLVKELLDDGTTTLGDIDTSVCMSPQRLCRYAYPTKNNADDSKAKEVFGAHTDTSFLTIVPCAFTAGLEVFNEDINAWVRPELIAKLHYEQQLKSQDTTTAENKDVAWHSRYVTILPGELLQLVSRSMILSSIHRVIAVQNQNKRVSAPILLRARSKQVMDVRKYFGDKGEISFLLDDCEDMSMEDIHDELQPR